MFFTIDTWNSNTENQAEIKSNALNWEFGEAMAEFCQLVLLVVWLQLLNAAVKKRSSGGSFAHPLNCISLLVLATHLPV